MTGDNRPDRPVFDRMDLSTPDLAATNAEKLEALFPNCVVETQDEDGNIQRSIDVDVLRQELSIVDDDKTERYQMTWPGKAESIVTGNTPIDKTLRPCRDESVDFDTTQNLFIEGDNLDALKLLQETYLGKVKMIYIDPPYNTGNDFVYDDNFTTDRDEYAENADYVDEYGGRLVANTDSNGRFHSDWLSMIYPRLRLARNLLSDDGVIFISIDDNEEANLRKICDEIFGEDNYLANIAWKHTKQSKNDEPYFSRNKNSIIAFRKSPTASRFRLPRTEEDNKNYSNPDNDVNGDWRSGDVRSPSMRQTLKFDIQTPSGKIISPPENGWRWTEDAISQKIASGEIIFSKDEDKIIRKIYLKDQDGRTPENVWDGDKYGTTRNANNQIKLMFDGKTPFDTPKPIELIISILNLSHKDKNFVVLDFFAGSGTTAHAVMALNAEDGGNRKCISVQLPEQTNEKSEAYKAGYANIADISKERIRRAGQKILADNKASKEPKDLSNLDIGFRVLKIDSGNRVDVKDIPSETSQDSLFDRVGNFKHDRTPMDLLFGCMLDWGVDLSLPIKSQTVAGKTVYGVYDRPPQNNDSTQHNSPLLMACFDDTITDDFTKTIATEHKPMRMVFKDASFKNNDSAKINTKEIFKTLSPTTEVKVI